MDSRAGLIFKKLEELYPQAGPELVFNNPLELMVAVMLSAQCTDKQVNKITKILFEKYKSAQDYAALEPGELAIDIKSCGLYKNKSKNIVESCKLLVEMHSSRVPDTLEELENLPGVGRKTANVILNVAFGKPALAVDTHVFRVSRRLGLASGKNPGAVEGELKELVPAEEMGNVHHRLIFHGRRICVARKPQCGQCTLSDLCGWAKEETGEGEGDRRQ